MPASRPSPVVSDASPLMNLAIIDRLELVREQAAEVLIPAAVRDELLTDETRPGKKALEAAFRSGWLRVRPVRDRSFVLSLRAHLDAGESEAIALAIQESAERLLIDERAGRRVAQENGLAVTGVLGILLRAKRVGSVKALEPLLEALRGEAGFWISDVLRDDVLRSAGER